MTKLCIIGVGGRMGYELLTAMSRDDSVQLVGAVESTISPHINKSVAQAIPSMSMIGGSDIVITSDIVAQSKSADVIVDFTGAIGTMANIDTYRVVKKPLVVGSTGFSEGEFRKLLSLKDELPLLWASNMSLGVNLLHKLVEIAAEALTDDFDIEIFESHHKHKKDAPSGTALTLAEAAARGRGVSLTDKAVFTREGITGERERGSIGFQVLRGGDIAGEHTVYFCGEGQRIELTHRATSRQPFATGALRAAKWLANKPSGLYSIKDVLEL